MIQYLCRHDKDYSRFNIIKQLTQNIELKNDIYILLPFSKNQFFKNFFKRDRIINDFFISNYDTYVYDRKKITNKNPRAWWKYFQDWFNFKFSKYLLSDTQAHFDYWESLFGKFNGEHFVFPVLADRMIYYPNPQELDNKKVKILFYGSFIPLHGIDVILKAFSLMEKNDVEFEANIIGNGQIYGDMKRLFDSLDLKNVKMDGNLIDEKSLANEIRDANILLGVFGKSKKAMSVVPNKVYQALASKKALITMKSSAIDEFFDTGDLVQCNNTPKVLSNAIEELMENKLVRDNYANNGYKKFLELYKNIKIDFKKFVCSVDEK